MNIDFSLLLENLTNPALLFFLLGIFSVMAKSDLAIPSSSSKFISLYLLFSIGFKGGQELSHETITMDLAMNILFGIGLSIIVPIYTFFILKKKFNVFDAGAVAASYGSVSAVTFVTAVNFMETKGWDLHGYMVAVMAFMESPAIIMGLLMISWFNTEKEYTISKRSALMHSLTNGSVFLILGSLLIGYLADAKQAEGIKPFTNDIFKGFLAVFLLDMGITSGRKLKSFFSAGSFPILFAIIIPVINGSFVAWFSQCITPDPGNRFIFSILAASASYIAVPAALKISVPKANPGLYLPMALAVTFPVNITVGMPLFSSIIQ